MKIECWNCLETYENESANRCDKCGEINNEMSKTKIESVLRMERGLGFSHDNNNNIITE